MESFGLTLVIAAIAVVALLAVFLIYSAYRKRKVAGFIRKVERIASSRIKDDGLTEELHGVLRDRNREEDRFDQLIGNARIIDLRDETDMDGLFRMIAAELSCRQGCTDEDVLQMLYEREAESTTVIQDGLAVPHIVTEGEHEFDIVVVRSKKGVLFNGSEVPVKMVFALSGSRDERNLHLKVLVAIAQITQSPEFLSAWLKAGSEDELRRLILDADRSKKGTI